MKNNLVFSQNRNYLKRKKITNYRLEKLQKPLFLQGKLVYDDPDINEKKKYCDLMMKTLYPEIKRNKLPHEYYVDGTKEYVEMKNDLIISIKETIEGE